MDNEYLEGLLFSLRTLAAEKAEYCMKKIDSVPAAEAERWARTAKALMSAVGRDVTEALEDVPESEVEKAARKIQEIMNKRSPATGSEPKAPNDETVEA